MEININCDLGEKSKHHSNKYDPELLGIVNSANIACGYHAGDEDTMRETIKISKKNGVSIGAHPSFNDLERVEKKVGLGKKEIVNQLISQKYFCYMTGFIAGMPFLGDIKEKIRLDRLETPRVKVPKGSVGITEQFCNIYTFESPGGWNIIGNSPKKIFTKDSTKLTLIDPGDEVEFFEISKKEYSKFNEQK